MGVMSTNKNKTPLSILFSISKQAHKGPSSRAWPSSLLFMGKNCEWEVFRMSECYRGSGRWGDSPGLDCVFQVWCMSMEWHLQAAETFGESEFESWWVKNCDLSLIIHTPPTYIFNSPTLNSNLPSKQFSKIQETKCCFMDSSSLPNSI